MKTLNINLLMLALGLTFNAGAMAEGISKADYKAGKEKAFNGLVGQVMKASKGKANPAQVNEVLKKKLA